MGMQIEVGWFGVIRCVTNETDEWHHVWPFWPCVVFLFETTSKYVGQLGTKEHYAEEMSTLHTYKNSITHFSDVQKMWYILVLSKSCRKYVLLTNWYEN